MHGRLVLPFQAPFAFKLTQCTSMTTQMDGQNDATEGAELPRRVLKFGGTSVSGASRLDVIARVLEGRLAGYNFASRS